MSDKIDYSKIKLNPSDIPVIIKQKKTFLGIAKQPHYENVMSNILAFYFNTTEEHGFGSLFIDTLQKIIQEKIKDKNLLKVPNLGANFEIFTEYVIEKKRIDILMRSEDKAIAIENKVYHHLNNDLNIYWKAIQEKKEKIGIVFSLRPVSDINHDHFINITHLEFMDRIFDKINPDSNTIDENYKNDNEYYVFLKDLYQNTKNLSNSYMKKDEVEFYYKNTEAINRAKDFHGHVLHFIKNEVYLAGKSLDGFNWVKPPKYNEDRLRYFVCKDNKDLMFTVVFDGLMKIDKTLELYIEVTGDLIKDYAKSKYVGKVDFEGVEIIINKDLSNKKNQGWAHYASVNIPIDEKNFANLSQFILDYLRIKENPEDKGKPVKSNFRNIFDELKERI